MSTLPLDLFDRRFADLVELARARIPKLAPAWTDHNYHDPGIMVAELLAWTAEAQIYALARMRTDERRAYAALMGIAPHGPLPATGLVWPTPGALPATLVEQSAALASGKPDAPSFWPLATVLLAPARLTGVSTRLASGARIDQAGANRPDGAGFAPFGPHAGRGDRLDLHFTCGPGQHLFSGLACADPAQARAARLALGVRVADGAAARQGNAATAGMPALRWKARLAGATGRFTIPVIADTTDGMTASGALLFDLGAVPHTPPLQHFTLELSAAAGFVVAPRIAALALNAIPAQQDNAVEQEAHVATGLPGQVVQLEADGLRFEGGQAHLQVSTARDGKRQSWHPVAGFDAAGPADHAYMVDGAAGQVSFGNGVNGALAPAGSQILFDYTCSAGAAGNLPRNQAWRAVGAGAVGSNPDPMTGGAAASDLGDLRRAARRAMTDAHALVTTKDLVQAALDAPGLQVARADVAGGDDPATLTLVAMRAPASGAPPEGAAHAPAESPRWLRALRCLLAPRMPLGQRLRVLAPRRLRIRVEAQLVATPRHDPDRLRTDALALLARRLDPAGWPLGHPVPVLQVEAWLRKLPGVARVGACRILRDDAAHGAPLLALPRTGLPCFDSAASTIVVTPSGSNP